MDKQISIRFWILVTLVAISGFSQGMLLPLIAIIFEQDGVSSTINGLHATGIYIGILLISPFMEKPLRKFGYKPIIMLGGIIVIGAFALFPLWKSLTFWFILRLLVGVGDNLLHFGTQTWITSFSPANKRGRNIALYGLFFSLGFAVGPMMTRLIEINEALPFIISALISLLTWITVFFLKNEKPEQVTDAPSFFSTFTRFRQVWKYAWIAFLLPCVYGVLEASLNGNFPVLALRLGIDIQSVSLILPAFSIGAIAFQLPLGALSDYYGRKIMVRFILCSGALIFAVAGFVQESVLGLIICFFIAGMIVGSTYSLGIAFMTDLLPRHLLPAGNIMCSISFSIGSIIGPFIGGLVLQYLSGNSFFYVISSILFGAFLMQFIFKPVTGEEMQSKST